jgi:hypothetical protein
VLRHLATCGECGRLVDEPATVADELLMLAPVQEPPVGFESRAIDALGFKRRAPHRRRLLVWLGPPVAAAAVTAVALVGVYHDDHVTAERYRTTLEQANGKYFQGEPLRDGTGAEAGVAFGYQGSQSWMLVTVDAGHRGQGASAELVTRDRRAIRAAGLRARTGRQLGRRDPGEPVRRLGDPPARRSRGSGARGFDVT